jgi:hypothetical protein
MSTDARTAPERVEDRLIRLAQSDPQQFNIVFPRLRKVMREEASRACVRYLADRGNDGAGQQMSSWLALSNTYLKLLLTADFLDIDPARKVAAILCSTDSGFFEKLLELTRPMLQKEVSLLLRALALLEALSDYSALLPWIMRATEHPDERIRSKAVRALLRLRPDSIDIDRHGTSQDARIRANAIEALWRVNNPETRKLFREALSHPHHRVVVNALIGLYYQGDETAFPKLIELAQHPSQAFRTAVVWAFGHLLDNRAAPILEEMVEHEPEPLRTKALKVLELLPTGQQRIRKIEEVAEPEVTKPPGQEDSAPESEGWDPLWKFEPLAEQKSKSTPSRN